MVVGKCMTKEEKNGIAYKRKCDTVTRNASFDSQQQIYNTVSTENRHENENTNELLKTYLIVIALQRSQHKTLSRYMVLS